MWKLLDEEQKLEVKASIVRQTIKKAIIKYRSLLTEELA